MKAEPEEREIMRKIFLGAHYVCWSTYLPFKLFTWHSVFVLVYWESI